MYVRCLEGASNLSWKCLESVEKLLLKESVRCLVGFWKLFDNIHKLSQRCLYSGCMLCEKCLETVWRLHWRCLEGVKKVLFPWFVPGKTYKKSTPSELTDLFRQYAKTFFTPFKPILVPRCVLGHIFLFCVILCITKTWYFILGLC